MVCCQLTTYHKPSFVRLIGAQWQNRIKSYKNEFYVFN